MDGKPMREGCKFGGVDIYTAVCQIERCTA